MGATSDTERSFAMSNMELMIPWGGVKSIHSDAHHRVGNSDGGQAAAELESILSNGCDRIRDVDGSQTAATIENTTSPRLSSPVRCLGEYR